MTSILYHSGLNYGATNPLRGELNTIRDSVTALEKNFKDIASSGGASSGSRGVTAGLKEVALQIVTLRSDIEGLKTRMVSAEAAAAAEKRRLDGVLADLTSRMTLTESAVGAAVNTVSALNATVSSLAAGAGVPVVAEVAGVDLLGASDEEAPAGAPAPAATQEQPEVTPAPVEETAVAADEDEAASEEILAMLRST